MKLLLDENLSPRLTKLLEDVYPESEHVDSLGMASAADAQVWEFAKANDFVIVSKDSDFLDISVLEGAPPKVVWVRLGNCTTASVAFLLRNSQGVLRRFVEGAETCLVLGKK